MKQGHVYLLAVVYSYKHAGSGSKIAFTAAADYTAKGCTYSAETQRLLWYELRVDPRGNLQERDDTDVFVRLWWDKKGTENWKLTGKRDRNQYFEKISDELSV